MATFQASPIPSPFLEPNELLNLAQAREVPQNALMTRARQQQEIGATDLEYASRLANSVLGVTDPAQRAQIYSTGIKQLQAAGLARNSPLDYPGDAVMEHVRGLGVSSEKQYEQRNNAAANAATWPVRTDAATPASGGAPSAVAPPAGGGFTGDREKDRALIVKQESGGDPTVLNYVARQDPTAYARGATASGKYQFVNSTWREGLQLAGLDPAQYPEARQAPEGVQDKVFDAIYGKYGTKPWEKGPKDWVRDENGNYQIATIRPPAGSPGGATASAAPGTPAPYQVTTTGAVPPPPGAPAGAVAPVAVPGAAGAPPVAPVAAPAPAATMPAPAPAIPVPTPPRFTNTGYTPEQNLRLDGMKAANLPNAQIRAQMDKFTDDNRAAVTQYQSQVTAARAAQQQAETLRIQQENLRLSQQARDLAADKWKAEQDRTARDVANPFGNSDTGLLRFMLSDPKSDPKSPTYHAAWAAYANPQTVNGVTMPGHVMTPFRMPLDEDGVPVTTYDKLPATLAPGDVSEYRKIRTSGTTLLSSLDDFAETARKASLSERIATVAKQPTDLSSAWTNVALMAKGQALYELGVLSGPDMSVLRGALADPSTFMGAMASTDTINKQVTRIKKLIETRLEQAKESYLPGVKTSDQPKNNSQTAPASVPDAGGWTVKRID